MSLPSLPSVLSSSPEKFFGLLSRSLSSLPLEPDKSYEHPRPEDPLIRRLDNLYLRFQQVASTGVLHPIDHLITYLKGPHDDGNLSRIQRIIDELECFAKNYTDVEGRIILDPTFDLNVMQYTRRVNELLTPHSKLDCDDFVWVSR